MDKTKENNYLLSLLAGFGLAFVGGLIYGLLYYFGFVAYLGAYLVFVLATIGFKKASKKSMLAKKDYIILSLLSILVVAITMFITLTIVIALEAGVNFGNAFSKLINMLGDSKVVTTVISDLIWGVAFVIAGAVSMFFVEKRKAKQEAEEAAKKQAVQTEEQPKEQATINENQPQEQTTTDAVQTKEQASADTVQTSANAEGDNK